jgi:hypothetical protein
MWINWSFKVYMPNRSVHKTQCLEIWIWCSIIPLQSHIFQHTPCFLCRTQIVSCRRKNPNLNCHFSVCLHKLILYFRKNVISYTSSMIWNLLCPLHFLSFALSAKDWACSFSMVLMLSSIYCNSFDQHVATQQLSKYVKTHNNRSCVSIRWIFIARC